MFRLSPNPYKSLLLSVLPCATEIEQQRYGVLALSQSAGMAHHNKLLRARALCTRFETVAGGQLHHCL